MATKRDVLLNPVISEFIYDCLMRTTVEQKKNLNGKFLKATRTSRTAKSFSVKSTMEEKAILLSKLGVPFSWNFNITKKKLNELFENRKDIKKSQLTDIMLKEKIIIITDKQVNQYLGLMAANCHSEIWLMNRDFLKAGHVLKDWRKEYFNATISHVRNSDRTAKDIAKLVVNSIAVTKLCESIFGIPEPAVSVLLYMFSKEADFITEQEMRVYFFNLYRGFKVTTAINKLLESKFIERGYLSNQKEFKVTAAGMEAALRFEKRMFSMDNF